MNFWWVNQKQTYRHEVPGRYMWSPKLDRSGKHLHAYDLMRRLRPGDVVFSYADSLLKAVGVVASFCYEFPKPSEFGSVGDYWSNIGWRVDVDFKPFANPVRTIDHIAQFCHLLPPIHAPVQPKTGRGNQAYLFQISRELAIVLAKLVDQNVVDLVSGNLQLEPQRDASAENLRLWEDRVQDSIAASSLPDTEKQALILARRGQGWYRNRVAQIEQHCRITKVTNPRHLIASHMKPWRTATHDERLNPENGLMLTPTVDHLFDRGFLSFEDSGRLIISPVSDLAALRKMNIPVDSPFFTDAFSEGQRSFLDWHRENILLS